MLEKRVRERIDLLNKAYEAEDYDSISSMYTEDSKIITVEYGIFEGLEGALAYNRGGREKAGVMRTVYEIISVDQLDDLITSFGRYTFYNFNDESMGTSWCMTAFKEVDGQLKIYRDVGM